MHIFTKSTPCWIVCPRACDDVYTDKHYIHRWSTLCNKIWHSKPSLVNLSFVKNMTDVKAWKNMKCLITSCPFPPCHFIIHRSHQHMKASCVWRVTLSTFIRCYYMITFIHIHLYVKNQEVLWTTRVTTMWAMTSVDPQLLSSANNRCFQSLADVWNTGNGLEWRSGCSSGLATVGMGLIHTIIHTHTHTLYFCLSVSHTHTKPVLLSTVAGCRGVKCKWTVSDRRWRPWCHPVWSHKDWLWETGSWGQSPDPDAERRCGRQ